jgi:hypothetical protein
MLFGERRVLATGTSDNEKTFVDCVSKWDTVVASFRKPAPDPVDLLSIVEILSQPTKQNGNSKRAEELEWVIDQLQRALRGCSRNDSERDWAMLHNDLGEAFRMRLQGRESENLEQAIHHYEQALEVLTGC